MPTSVLVVDDDPVLCEFLHDVLLLEKMEACIMTDTSQAMARLRQERFDAVFLDMNMPGTDGIELAKWIRSSHFNKTTPLIMITGNGDRTLLGRAFQAGVNFFLPKPVDRPRLMRLLRVAENFIQREKRRFVRVKISRPISIEFAAQRLKGTTLDLSLRGAFVQAPSTFPVGSDVLVNLELTPGNPPLQFSARVARTSGEDCMGLEFAIPASETLTALETFLLPLLMNISS